MFSGLTLRSVPLAHAQMSGLLLFSFRVIPGIGEGINEDQFVLEVDQTEEGQFNIVILQMQIVEGSFFLVVELVVGPESLHVL